MRFKEGDLVRSTTYSFFMGHVKTWFFDDEGCIVVVGLTLENLPFVAFEKSLTKFECAEKLPSEVFQVVG